MFALCFFRFSGFINQLQVSVKLSKRSLTEKSDCHASQHYFLALQRSINPLQSYSQSFAGLF